MIRAYAQLLIGLLFLLMPLVSPCPAQAGNLAEFETPTPPPSPLDLSGWQMWFQHVATWGQHGSGPAQFHGLHSLAIHPVSGFIFCTDTHNHRVQILDANGWFSGSWGRLGSAIGQLSRPTGLAISAQGWVYVVDEGNDRIQVFNASGQPLLAWAVHRPRGVAIGPAGDVYVLCQPHLHQVRVYSANGQHLRTLALQDNRGRYVEPSRILVSPAGRLYATDPFRQRMVAFALNGEYALEWEYQGGTVTGLGMSAADGLIYVSEDLGGTHVQTLAGLLLDTLPVSGATSIAVRGGNPATVYLAAQDRIQVYRQYLQHDGFRSFLPHLYRPLDPTAIPIPTSTPTSRPSHTPGASPTATVTETGEPQEATPTPTTWSDNYEPNDSFDQAWGPLASGLAYRAYIWSRHDEDYYYFRIQNLSPIVVDLTNPPPDTDYDLYLYDGDGALAAKSEQLGSVEHITYQPVRLGIYYVLVRSYDGRSSRHHPYALTVTYGATVPTPTVTTVSPYPWPPTPTPLPTQTPTRPLAKSTPTPPRPTRTFTPTPWASHTPTPRR